MASTSGLDRYREITLLGAGGMATVTLARDTLLQRPVALKRVRVSGDARGMLRLEREALVGASISHPNLVSVYDAQLQGDGDVVIVMEYVRGGTLADRIGIRGRLPPREAVRILRGIATALDTIHTCGIVHRDVKPANVLLGDEGEVKLADLGIADVTDRTRITSSGAIVGSFSYMAPEQLEGAEPGPKMDIYALAAVAYEALGGHKARPEPNPLALAHAISTRPPPDLRDIWPAAPAAAAAVLQRGMAADPARRPATAGELVDRLERALAAEQPTRPEPAAPPEQPTRTQPALKRPDVPRPAPTAPSAPAASDGQSRARSPAPLLVVVAALALAVVAIVVLTSGGGGRAPAAGGDAASRHARAVRQSGTAAGRRSTPRHTSSALSAAASGRAGGPSGASPTAGAPSTPGGAASGTGTPGVSSAPTAPVSAVGASRSSPVAAVEGFYEAAAHHQYATAWALADADLHDQVGGYSLFQSQMSPVRSITFQSARMIGGGSTGLATVAVQTTSVQADRTQQCSGTARTVQSGGGWLLDHISINCV